MKKLVFLAFMCVSQNWTADKIVTQKKKKEKITGAANPNPKVRAGKPKLKQETPAKLKNYKKNKEQAVLQLYK